MKNKILVILVLLTVAAVACQKKAVKRFGPDLPEEEVETKSLYEKISDYQLKYILATQLPSGAMRDTEADGARICGYFANSACRALLTAPSTENVAAVKRYIVWYLGKLNGNINPYTAGTEIPGSIYDYYGADETSQGTYDSVDSYAATFLALLRELAALSEENKAWVATHAEKIALVASAMEACIDTDYNDVPTSFGPDDNDGLSVDSYVHGAKYLMDNAEVNEGLKAMVWLEERVLGGAKKNHFQTLLDKNTAAIEKELWRRNRYNWVDDGSRGVSNANWGNFYADATAQLYPGMFAVVEPGSDRANMMYTLFNTNYPNWSNGTTYTTYPWAIICNAAAVMNDKARVDEYLRHIVSYNDAGAQKPYWHNAEAAFVVLAAHKIKNQASLPLYSPRPIVEDPIDEDGNLALGKIATASESFNAESLSVDGNMQTRWSTVAGDNQWYKVDLGAAIKISRVAIFWEGAFASDYALQVSTDDQNYATVYSTTEGAGGDVSHQFTATDARYVKILLNKAGTPWPMSFWEFEVYKE